jgi:hypothetical protein
MREVCGYVLGNVDIYNGIPFADCPFYVSLDDISLALVSTTPRKKDMVHTSQQLCVSSFPVRRFGIPIISGLRHINI